MARGQPGGRGLGLLLVQTGWWQYLWILFGGANQLMASLALLLVSVWLCPRHARHLRHLPMMFMFVTTIAALLYTSYNLLSKVASGQAKGEALVGNGLMGFVSLGWWWSWLSCCWPTASRPCAAISSRPCNLKQAVE